MEQHTGIICKITGGFYYVEAAESVYECKARGVFRKRGTSPLVGDIVDITVPNDGYCSIDRIHERRNFLVRPALANLDNLMIISSVREPDVNLYLVDKMTAAAVSKDITPIVVFTKSDLASVDSYVDIYRRVNIPAYAFSCMDNRGLDEIKAELKGKVTAFCGNSGVGKSTLLNALFPELELQTGEISEKLGRGRHTTRTVELFKKHGGYIADTPGFSTVDIERFELIRKDELKFAFPEFEDYFGTCQFNSCNHVCEKGCKVLDAVSDGVIPQSRHDSYVRMYNEVKDIKDWQINN
ncbi:MAG: ribosome small subunit-dependent GTPase A [Ruminococcus sp.]|uniref:ribosome small subunit-dependent GTPase A n=1 Tax=Ruminococcus sp. TaxID=41978 RepID=UPI0028733739|nr:ribosome small subunit-dependent GTPase A [Ruminococcus sp.]MBQ3285948.1 ribosome small subunit-dependent GTPase A [Ruminococcus sp.]